MADAILTDRYKTGAGEDEVLVTVAMPVYNAGRYLRLAVLSIVQQSFTHWELLIIDDGSTDDSLASIADLDDSRIRVFCDGQNKGLAVRLNQACDLARGRYVARMDQDDVSYPLRLQRQVEALDTDAGVDLVATRAVTINEGNALTGLFPCALSHEQICARPWRGFVFPHPTWMGRLEWFKRHGYPVPAPYLCEDQELLLRTYRRSSFRTLDEVLFAYRIRDVTVWPKLGKTRRAVLAVQVRFFWKSGMWVFLTLACAAYVVKSGVDCARRLGLCSQRFQPAGDALASGWRLTLIKLKAAMP